MVKPDPIQSSGSALWNLAWSTCLVVLLGLVWPASVLAAPPVDDGAEKCVECHEQETDAWRHSPHARASAIEDERLSATCEACHGPYVEDHPEQGVMQLTVDSAICQDCHTATFDQWQASTHAEAGVQCIGCHLSHSQSFRLTDDALCASCHQDRAGDFDETCHGIADVACTDCHLSSTPSTPKGAESIAEFSGSKPSGLAWVKADQQSYNNPAIMALIEFDNAGDASPDAPSHDFTEVSSEDCMACHREEVHEATLCTHGNRDAHQKTLIKAEGLPELAAKLETVKNENRSLQIMAPVSMGLGVGIGVMLGIILMLAIGYICQGRSGK